ncbi:MAG: hypothetical protein LBE27_01620 [Deltaproteobacteria bacterium]|jgi:hypothetical protein|nr:hypothetical protein [Deltaproteobacteria bacterium]
MDILIDALGHFPDVSVSEWLKIYIPGTSVEGSFPIPPEFKDYFQDCLYPPSILFFANSILDTTARLFNKSGAPDYRGDFPDKVKHPNLKVRLQEWKKLMEVVEIDRINKRSRVLKRSGAIKCSLAIHWDEHPHWPDWQEPVLVPQPTMGREQWKIWAETRTRSRLTLVK